MHDNPTRRLFRVMFRMMAYRTPRIAVPPRGVTLRNVTVINPGYERQTGQTIVVAGDRIVQVNTETPAALRPG